MHGPMNLKLKEYMFPDFFLKGTNRIHTNSAGYWHVTLFKSLDCMI